jgi:hypothetical protein
VTDWYRNFPEIDGIFFDEGSKFRAPAVGEKDPFDLYKRLRQHVLGQRPNQRPQDTVLLNVSGFQQDPEVYSLADVLVISEYPCVDADPFAAQYRDGPDGKPLDGQPAWFADLKIAPPEKTLMVAVNCKTEQIPALLRRLADPQHHARYVYIYDGGTNDYGHFPGDPTGQPDFWRTQLNLVQATKGFAVDLPVRRSDGKVVIVPLRL